MHWRAQAPRRLLAAEVAGSTDPIEGLEPWRLLAT